MQKFYSQSDDADDMLIVDGGGVWEQAKKTGE